MAMSKSMVYLEISVSTTLTPLYKVENLYIFISRNQTKQTVRINFACLFAVIVVVVFCFSLFFAKESDRRNQ